MHNPVQITVVRCDGWVAAYKDDLLVDQNHSLNWPYILSKYFQDVCIVGVKTIYVRDAWAEQEGWFPDRLTEIPGDAFCD